MAIDTIGYSSREDLIRELQLRLADGIVDVELDREHYDIAINKALSTYRQLSAGSVEESIIFIETVDGQTDYTLPDEVMEVRRIYRRGIGTNSGGGTNFDPFDVAFNNMYMLQAGQIWERGGNFPKKIEIIELKSGRVRFKSITPNKERILGYSKERLEGILRNNDYVLKEEEKLVLFI